MYLSRFGVKNYKCLGDIDIPLTPIHVLIGQNDCGKTSLLEAIAAFFATAERPVSEVFPMPWQGRELVRHNSGQEQIELCGKWDDIGTNNAASSAVRQVAYGLSLSLPLNGLNCQLKKEWIGTGTHQAGDPVTKMSLHDVTSVKFWKDRNNPPPASIAPHTIIHPNYSYASTPQFIALTHVLKPVHKYALDAKLMAVPAAFESARKFRLDPDGFGLPTLLDDILGFDPELFLRLRAEFCKFFPQFKSLRLESAQALRRQYDSSGLYSSEKTVGKGIYFETINGQTIRAQQASDGAILFLGFLAIAYLPDPPNLLLIEEPENGIYPTRLGQVITLLKQLVNGTDGVRFPQIILTTHSPYVLSFFEPEEVTLLSRPSDTPDAPVRARPLRDAPNIRERMGSEFYLGELWYNLSEGELFADAV